MSELPSGKVYENMNIWVGNKGTADPENIENAVIGFRVERSWIDSNDVDPAMLRLWRFGSHWEELSTRQSGEDDRYIYFEAQTPGFSSFAIIALPDANETVGENEESSAVSSVRGADIMGTLIGELSSKQNSSFLELSALPVNENSSSMEGYSIASKAVERITGKGVMRALAVISLLSVTGYLGSLILRKQE
ncbi:hypothetical protein SDC9_192705 [bioreactor metagenome]|uniref:PGF-pre-PGF domain-containing protein n=1 Tax=bioreactor metagenome TaxID=1076179 RepID=A0A645I1L3_9ZZZZ